MCVAGCLDVVHQRLDRRRLLTGVGLAATAAVLPQAPALASQPRSFSRVVDLTHPLGPGFPTYFGPPGIEMERLTAFDEDGYNMFRWLLVEHTGTHIDAPIHFSSDGQTADAIPPENLVVPLVIVDIRGKAADDADAQVTPEDLQAFESEHGPVPEGACVAMLSGWAGKTGGDGFRNADADGVMHFPGFHVEAADYLMSERNAIGIGVDTLSLDYGRSADFATHYAWLPTNRWGLECLARLDELPPAGATLVVGSPMIEGATGGPSRVFALV
jgi:kynurenine formamidase